MQVKEARGSMHTELGSDRIPNPVMGFLGCVIQPNLEGEWEALNLEKIVKILLFLYVYIHTDFYSLELMIPFVEDGKF